MAYVIVAAVGVLWWGMSDPGGLWAQEQYSEPTLTLRTALELADRHSPLLSSERSLTQAARAGAIAAKDSLFPRLQVTGGYLRDDAQEKLLIRRTRLDGLSADEKFNSEIYDFQVILNYPIFAPKISHQADAEAALANAVSSKELVTRDRLYIAVVKVYYRILLLSRSILAVEASIEGLQETRRIIERNVDLGRLPPIALLRIKTRLSKVELDLLNLTNDQKQQWLILEALVGTDLHQNTELIEELTLQSVDFDQESSVQFALENRPDIQALQYSLERAMASERVIGSTYIPVVNLTLNRSRYWGNNAPDPVDDLFVGVRFTVPLYDPTYSPKKSKAAANVAATRYRLSQLNNNVQAEVLGAFLDMEKAQQATKVTEYAFQLAKEAFRLEQKRFEIGHSTINDVLQAQADLLSAELGNASALLKLKFAVARLFQVRGDVSIDNLAPLGGVQ